MCVWECDFYRTESYLQSVHVLYTSFNRNSYAKMKANKLFFYKLRLLFILSAVS